MGKGLFKATGNVSTVADVPRVAHDFYPTPPEPTEGLLRHEGERLTELRTIWEPAAGDGAMADVLRDAGLWVYTSDLIDRGCGAAIKDFFAYSAPRGRAIVTNPPYNLINARDGKGRWLKHAMDIGVDYCALFLNADWAAAKGHSELLKEHPISRVYICRWKVDFTGKGAPPQRNAWFIWDKDWQGETAYRFMDRKAQ